MPPKPKPSNSALLLLFLSVFVDLIGLGIVIPLLPFVAQKYGAGPTQITLFFALYSFTQFLFTPLWGSLSDRIGRRPLLLLSFFGSGVAYLWFAFANVLVGLYAARALAGAMSCSVTIAQAYVADITTVDQRAKGMGAIGAAFGCGFTLGPALGGLLAGTDTATPNFQLPLLVAAGLSFTSMVFAFFKLPETLPAKTQGSQRESGDHRRWDLTMMITVLRSRQILFLIGILVLFSFATVGTQPVLMLWCDSQFEWGPQAIGLLLMLFGLISITIQGGLIGILTKRFSERNILIVGVMAQGFGLLTLPLAQTTFLLVLSGSIWIGGEALSRPALSSLLSRRANATEQGSTLGVAQSLSSLARIFGPIWAGYVYVSISGAWSFWSGALLMLVAITCSYQIQQPKPQTAPLN